MSDHDGEDATLSRAITLEDLPKHPRSPMRDEMVSSHQAVARKRLQSSNCWLAARPGRGDDDAMADRGIPSRIGDLPFFRRRFESHWPGQRCKEPRL